MPKEEKLVSHSNGCPSGKAEFQFIGNDHRFACTCKNGVKFKSFIFDEYIEATTEEEFVSQVALLAKKQWERSPYQEAGLTKKKKKKGLLESFIWNQPLGAGAYAGFSRTAGGPREDPDTLPEEVPANPMSVGEVDSRLRSTLGIQPANGSWGTPSNEDSLQRNRIALELGYDAQGQGISSTPARHTSIAYESVFRNPDTAVPRIHPDDIHILVP